MAAREKQEAQRDSKQRRQHQPARAVQVNFFPILHHHDTGDRNRHQHCERSSNFKGNKEGEQRNGYESLAKAKGGPNQSSDENDE